MRRLAVQSILLLMLFVPGALLSAEDARKESCGEIVRKALASTDRLCEQTGRNEVCYGHKDLLAVPRAGSTGFQFTTEGDIEEVAKLSSLRLSGLDMVTQTWGVALMRLQVGVQSEQNLTLLVFGDVELENRSGVGQSVGMVVGADQRVNVREAPNTSAAVVSSLAPGQSVTATGWLSDHSWIRISLADGQGWVYAPLLTSDEDLTRLAVVEADMAQYGAMHAFYFESSLDDSTCAEAPSSGILIQTPEGMAEVSLLINEVDIRLGSTVYLQAEAGKEMVIRVVEGSAQVETFGVVEQAAAGYEIHMPLNEDLTPADVPAPAEPYQMSDVQALPVDLLERDITVQPPGDVSEATADVASEPTRQQTKEPEASTEEVSSDLKTPITNPGIGVTKLPMGETNLPAATIAPPPVVTREPPPIEGTQPPPVVTTEPPPPATVTTDPPPTEETQPPPVATSETPPPATEIRPPPVSPVL